MATDDRKRRILDHLSRSTTGADYIPQKPLPIVETPPVAAEPVAAPPPVTPSPELTAKERKRKIMSHLSMSSQDIFREKVPEFSPQSLQWSALFEGKKV